MPVAASARPAITIVMPLFNAERYVRQAIVSCLRQTLPSWELVVVDDASTDGSAALVSAIKDPRVHLVRLHENGGPAAARNVALEMAMGEWITVLDADDLFHEDRLRVLFETARRHGADKIYFDQMVPWRPATEPPEDLISAALAPAEPLPARTVAQWFAAGHAGQPFFHRSALGTPPVRYPDTRAAQDTAFLVRLSKVSGYRVSEVPIPSYIYRIVEGSITTRSEFRFREVRKAYEILQREFADDEPLMAAIDAAHERMAIECEFMHFRSAVASSEYKRAGRLAVSSPQLLFYLVRRIPVWLAYRYRRG